MANSPRARGGALAGGVGSCLRPWRGSTTLSRVAFVGAPRHRCFIGVREAAGPHAYTPVPMYGNNPPLPLAASSRVLRPPHPTLTLLAALPRTAFTGDDAVRRPNTPDARCRHASLYRLHVCHMRISRLGGAAAGDPSPDGTRDCLLDVTTFHPYHGPVANTSLSYIRRSGRFQRPRGQET